MNLFFSSSPIDCSNSYHGLTDSLVDSDVTFDLCSGSDGNPKTSTPTKDDIVGQKPIKYHKNKKQTIKGMIINCNSLRSGDKQATFHSIIEHHQPDIVLGCESKIDNTYATYEVFPDNFTVYRKDRIAGGGGVFIAIRDSLITSSEPSLDGDCEIVGANIEFANSRPLFIASFYRPPGSNCQPLDALSNIFSNLVSKNRRQHPNVIIGGIIISQTLTGSAGNRQIPKPKVTMINFWSFCLKILLLNYRRKSRGQFQIQFLTSWSLQIPIWLTLCLRSSQACPITVWLLLTLI